MGHVTFETAKRLEAAGFTQPKIQFGQIWYENVGLGIPKLIIAKSKSGVRVADIGGSASTVALSTLTFAPTATDIMEQMDGESIRFKDGSLERGIQIPLDQTFFVPVKMPIQEALAMDYIKSRENK